MGGSGGEGRVSHARVGDRSFPSKFSLTCCAFSSTLLRASSMALLSFSSALCFMSSSLHLTAGREPRERGPREMRVSAHCSGVYSVQ